MSTTLSHSNRICRAVSTPLSPGTSMPERSMLLPRCKHQLSLRVRFSPQSVKLVRELTPAGRVLSCALT